MGRLAPAFLIGGLLLGPQFAAGEDLPDIRERGTLRVLVVPFTNDDEFFSLGTRPGFDHELVDAFCSLQKLKVEVVPVPTWDGLVPALRAGKGDLIAGSFSNTEARRRLIDFTSEVFPTRNVVVTLKPHKPIRDLDELKGEHVGIVRGTSMGDALVEAGIPKSAIDDSSPAGGLLPALKQGKISVGVMGVEQAISAQRTDPALDLGVFLGVPGSLAWGVRKDSPLLLKALDDYVDNVRKSQTWSRLVIKYFGERAPEILKKARGE
jgi:membrane-bound lytic murein transglycosylase F